MIGPSRRIKTLSWDWQCGKQLRAQTSGTMTIEAMIVVPLLAMAMIFCFVLFDMFRTESIEDKATYTLADTISRQDTYITADYITTLYNLHKFLVLPQGQSAVRVSVVSYDPDAERYELRWSKGLNGNLPTDTPDLDKMSDHLPRFPEGEVGIVVESWAEYIPPFSVGFSSLVLSSLKVVRPREGGQMCWHPDSANGDPDDAIC